MIKEKEFMYENDYKCIISLNDCGYRCGYVGIPLNLLKDKYNNIRANDIEGLEMVLYCHGGINYSSDKTPVTGKQSRSMYWIGFSCDHLYDQFDEEAVLRIYKYSQSQLEYNCGVNHVYPQSILWTLDMVEFECKSLVHQLISIFNRTSHTKIISAFPGTGKSYLTKRYVDGIDKDIIMVDSDSSKYSWLHNKNRNKTKTRNPNFIEDYMNSIKEEIKNKPDIIFTSTHEDILNAIHNDPSLRFRHMVILPDISLKDTYIQRYKDRLIEQPDHPLTNIKLIEDNWEKWLTDIRNSPNKYNIILIDRPSYMTIDLLFSFLI